MVEGEDKEKSLHTLENRFIFHSGGGSTGAECLRSRDAFVSKTLPQRLCHERKEREKESNCTCIIIIA